MDPLSIAAGIAGLLSLTLQVSKGIKTFAAAAIHERRDVHNLVGEIESIHSVLEELFSFLKGPQVNAIVFQHSSALQIAMETCTRTIEDLQKRLQKLEAGRLARSLERLKWPFSEKENQKVLETLGRCAATFQFALTVEGW